MYSLDDVFNSGGMETLKATTGNCQYFDTADEEVNTAEPSETPDSVAMFRERASLAVRKKKTVSAMRTRLSARSDVSGLKEQEGSITSRTRSKSKLGIL